MKIHTNNLSQLTILMVFIITAFFGLGGNAQTNSESVQTERMTTIHVLYTDGHQETFWPSDPDYDYWDEIRQGDSTDEILETYIVDGETYFDITWMGPHPEDSKNAIRAGFDHSTEKFAIANSSNHANVKIVSTGLGGALAVTVVDWILGDPGTGLIWYPAFLIENLPGGSNTNGTDFDFEISWDWTMYGSGQWSLLTNGTYVSGTYSLMYVIMHEILTGMGFQSSATYDPVWMEYTLGWSGFPAIFDRFIIDGSGAFVWDNPNYQSSAEWGAFFTGDQAYFLNNYENSWSKLYAESTYAQGTSALTCKFLPVFCSIKSPINWLA